MIIRYKFCQSCIVLSVLHIHICCDPSSEPSQQGGSDEGSQHMVSVRNKKNYPSNIIKYSPYLELRSLPSCLMTVCSLIYYFLSYNNWQKRVLQDNKHAQ